MKFYSYIIMNKKDPRIKREFLSGIDWRRIGDELCYDGQIWTIVSKNF